MASNQLAIKEVLNFEVFNYTTGVPVFFVDYAEQANLEFNAERLDLRGGQGNYKLVSFDYSKDATLKSRLPLVDLNFLAVLGGTPMVTGTATVQKREILTSSGATPTITLTATPTSGLKIYTLSGDRDNGTEQVEGTPSSQENQYSISGAVVTLNATSGVAGTQFAVNYKYSAAATTKTITYYANRMVDYYRIVCYGLVTDQVTGATYPTVIDIAKCKPKQNYTVSMSSTAATMLEIDWDIYPVASGNDKLFLTMNELVT